MVAKYILMDYWRQTEESKAVHGNLYNGEVIELESSSQCMY